MIDKMNMHYAFTNPASIHDEEALTALELAGRTAKKTNEVVEDQNNLRTETEDHLAKQDTDMANKHREQDTKIENRLTAQDNKLEQRLTAQDNAIENVRAVTVPADVKAECQRLIASGEFDLAINLYMDNLNARLDNLLSGVSEGSTTMDAEVIDIRTDANGVVFGSAGDSVRSIYKKVRRLNDITNNRTTLYEGFNGFKRALHVEDLPASCFVEDKLVITHPSDSIMGVVSMPLDYENMTTPFYVSFTTSSDNDCKMGVYVSRYQKFSTENEVDMFKWIGKASSNNTNTFRIDPSEYEFDIKYIIITTVSGEYPAVDTEVTYTDFTVFTSEMVENGLSYTVGEALLELNELVRATSIDYTLIKDDMSYFHEWGNLSGNYGTDIDSVTYESVTTGSSHGICSPLLELDQTKHMHVSFDVELTGDVSGVSLWISNTANYSENSASKFRAYTNGHYDVDVDITEHDFDTNYLWFICSGEIGTFTISNLKIEQSKLMDAGYSSNIVDAFVEHCEKVDSQNVNGMYSNIESNMGQYSKWGSNVEITQTKNSVTATVTGTTGSVGVCSPVYKFNNGYQLHLSFDLEITDLVNKKIAIWIAEKKSYVDGTCKNVYSMSSSGHYDVTIDLPYHAVYDSIEPCYLWFITGGALGSFTISNLTIEQSELMDLGYPPHLYDAFIEHCKTGANTEEREGFMVSPSGNRFLMQVGDNGVMNAVPVVPNKTLFIGNSLLQGFTEFGMAASDSEHDYYYLVNNAIAEQNPEHTSLKVSGTQWEGKTTIADQNAWMQNTLAQYLTDDLDLVIVQLGDNVNTDAKKAIFAEGCQNLLRFIRNAVPNARVVWVGAWYQTEDKQRQMIASCNNTGSLFVNIWDLNVSANRSAIGNTYTMADGTVNTITDSGVASHPGDNGMKAIANRILYNLSIVDTLNYYK